MKPTRPMKPVIPKVTAWWPSELGTPTSSGSTERLRYAYFPLAHRLVIEREGAIKLYDTANFQFRGVLQAGGEDRSSLSFLSQHGRVKLEELPLVQDQPPGHA